MLAPEMIHFLNDIYNVVVAEMELLLATCEVQPKEKNAQDCESYFQVSQLPVARKPQQPSMLFKRPKSIESKDIRLALLKTPASQVNGEGAHLYLRPVIDPAVLCCPESDVLGDVLCAIISRGPESLSTVCERLGGKLLPQRLRPLIWMSKLLRAGSRSPKAKALASIEREARVSFGRTVAWQNAEQKLRTATRSPVSGLIENAVVEKYSKTPCMSHFATDVRVILETSKTLNVLYVFNGTYEPYLIPWLFPLQVTFQQITPTGTGLLAFQENPNEYSLGLDKCGACRSESFLTFRGGSSAGRKRKCNERECCLGAQPFSPVAGFYLFMSCTDFIYDAFLIVTVTLISVFQMICSPPFLHSGKRSNFGQ